MRTAVALAAALTACTSSYVPQSRGRVGMILQGGAQAYVRDGRIYPHGFLGGGLLRAVAGNPAAERAAREYHDRQRTGLLVGLGGMLCSAIAAGAMLSDLPAANAPVDDHAPDVPTAAWVAAGCLIASMGGVGYILTAEPYRYDAINIFNDTTPAWSPGGPGQYGAISQRAAPTLRMRD